MNIPQPKFFNVQQEGENQFIVTFFVSFGPLTGLVVVLRVKFTEYSPRVPPNVTLISPKNQDLFKIILGTNIFRVYDKVVIRSPHDGWRESYGLREVLLKLYWELLNIDAEYEYGFAGMISQSQEYMKMINYCYPTKGDVLGIVVYKHLHVNNDGKKWSGLKAIEMASNEFFSRKNNVIPISMYDECCSKEKGLYFLPLYLNPTHGDACMEILSKKLGDIIGQDIKIDLNDFRGALAAFRVIGLVMKGIVSQACVAHIDTHKHIRGLVQMHHLILAIAERFPNVSRVAHKVVNQLITTNSATRKKYLTDISMFLTAFLLVNEDITSWSKFGPYVFREVLCKNVATHSSFEDLTHPDRSKRGLMHFCQVGKKTISHELKMFVLNAWLMTYFKKTTKAQYDAHRGRPSQIAINAFYKRVESATTCDGWKQLLEMSDLRCSNPNAFADLLSQAVIDVSTAKYAATYKELKTNTFRQIVDWDVNPSPITGMI